ncbi:transglutaminase family protein [Leptospira semungkisensis]|uniref:Transglutaminase family protein n=1 Tax=Leptospira semungkisensis TaxID=2484985 RepID=A0A4R9FN71_9LEPT|nr:transglutaminase family protein [Leptospira semungkisensis]TGJ99704.1 transglutaminase family protein [Leptospira semungkisensis]
MSLLVSLTHETSYEYDRPVNLSPHVIRLRPAPHSRTRIVSYSLNVEPAEQFLNWQQDPFGNYQARLVFPKKTEKLKILVDLVAEIQVINPFDFFLEPDAEETPFIYSDALRKELLPYLSATDGSHALANYISSLRKDGILKPKRTVDFLVGLNQRVYQDVSYVIRMEPGVQTCTETLERKSGSCRDSAFLLVQILRHIGLASRFVSGYLIQLKPDEVAVKGPAGPKEDFTDLHAWAEVFLPGAGWVGLDPTSGLFAGEGHIPLAAVPEPVSASPVFGYSDPADTKFGFRMEVKRFQESPRVTKPYSDNTWERVLRLGKHLDERCKKNDIRISIGGEPTFISDKDRQDPQWNTAALGKEKLEFGETLLEKLREHFSPGSLVQVTQGKWYPGEPLPRWSLNTFWRKDGEALWKNKSLLSSSEEKKVQDVDKELEKAKSFGEKLCSILGVSSKHIVPLYEDGFYYLWKEGQFPEWADPKNTESLSEDFSFEALERKKTLSLMDRNFKLKKAFAIPLQFNYISSEWESSEWKYKREKLFLIPGDSPAGFRLPFSSISDTFRMSAVLTDISRKKSLTSRKEIDSRLEKRTKKEPKFFATGSDLPIRTTLVLEPRSGVLRIFLPPVEGVEPWLDLIASIEEAAKTCGVEVVLEGYEPPSDSRLGLFRITPDPGVLEVNLHPSSNFKELEEKTRILYEEARELGLSAEKFMIDGRHTGTGGGNHITVGAMSPDDSPFLRRPDLLRSLVSYWQHHPSLSYLFSGLFIGPTSQAPRLDEGRDESLYEFELAASQLEQIKEPNPWLVDRLFRNLLTDLTGNTHRAEISIDKLYPPSGSRLGLVELRGFEMPPHHRMSVVQQLLVLSLLCRFWEKPYTHPPIYWGTELHDRFLLPHFVWNDFKNVLQDLKEHGFDFKEEEFLPFFEFRFPLYGKTQREEVFLELRMALEPWNVLGEEASSFGTSRAVDSALERLQVKVEGWSDRYLLSCNGYEVPLKSTGRKGEAVSGIRFKAWNPVFTLHPNLPTHPYLVFDIWDTWSSRPLGGCRYYVSHPGGRAYDTYPVNSFEAESRRISRFHADGHSVQNGSAPKKVSHSGGFTLDLRWADSIREK